MLSPQEMRDLTRGGGGSECQARAGGGGDLWTTVIFILEHESLGQHIQGCRGEGYGAMDEVVIRGRPQHCAGRPSADPLP
jgi:hypothetical protein